MQVDIDDLKNVASNNDKALRRLNNIDTRALRNTKINSKINSIIKGLKTTSGLAGKKASDFENANRNSTNKVNQLNSSARIGNINYNKEKHILKQVNLKNRSNVKSLDSDKKRRNINQTGIQSEFKINEMNNLSGTTGASNTSLKPEQKFEKINDSMKSSGENKINLKSDIASENLNEITGTAGENTINLVSDSTSENLNEITGVAGENKISVEYTEMLIKAFDVINNESTEKIGNALDLSSDSTALFHFETLDGKKILLGSNEYNDCVNNNIELKLVTSKEFNDISKEIINKYNIKDRNEVMKIISLMNNSFDLEMYTSLANEIINVSSSMPEQFELMFGYSSTSPYSNVSQNIEVLTLDLFINLNFDSIFIKDENEKIELNPKTIKYDSNGNCTLKKANNESLETLKSKYSNYVLGK